MAPEVPLTLAMKESSSSKTLVVGRNENSEKGLHVVHSWGTTQLSHCSLSWPSLLQTSEMYGHLEMCCYRCPDTTKFLLYFSSRKPSTIRMPHVLG